MRKLLILTFLPLLLFSGCKSTLNLTENLPRVQFKGVRLSRFPADLSQNNLEIQLGLRFNYVNPFRTSLSIPTHQVDFRVNGAALPGSATQQSGFTIPAQSERLVTYLFTFDLDSAGSLGQQGLNLLGKDNVYEFATRFELDLLEYASEIFGLNVGDLGADPSSPLSPYRRQLENYEIKLGFGDTLRLPAIPRILPASRPMKVQFLGQMESIDLSGVKNAMSPMVTLLDQGFAQMAQPDPFVQLLTDTVQIPLIGKTSIADYVVSLAAPLHPQASVHWQSLKSKMLPPANTPAMVHFLDQFVPGVNGNAGTAWTNLQQAYQSLDDLPDEIEYPGPQTTGLVVEIPFIFENRNEFPVMPPQLFTHASLGSGQPIAFEASPTNASSPVSVPGGAKREMHVRLTLDWAALSNGFGGLFSGQNLQPNLVGETVLDMGYGPMPLKLDLNQLMLQTGNN